MAPMRSHPRGILIMGFFCGPTLGTYWSCRWPSPRSSPPSHQLPGLFGSAAVGVQERVTALAAGMISARRSTVARMRNGAEAWSEADLRFIFNLTTTRAFLLQFSRPLVLILGGS